jgi:hypothetical protein
MKNFIAIIILTLVSTVLAFGHDGMKQKPAEAPELVSFSSEDGGLIYANLYGKGDRAVVLDSGAKPDCSDSGKIAGDYTSEASYAA